MYQMPLHSIANKWYIVPQSKVFTTKGFLHCVLCEHQPKGYFEHRVEPQAWVEAEDMLDVQAKGNEWHEKQRAV
jgi:hypothetical protein